MEPTFPKKNTRFTLPDFFQIEVDDFITGDFLFLSAKKVKTQVNENVIKDIESVDEYGWVVSTYCYTYQQYWKIFVCDFKPKPWHNCYHIRSAISNANECDGYSEKNDIKEFSEWIMEGVIEKIDSSVNL